MRPRKEPLVVDRETIERIVEELLGFRVSRRQITPFSRRYPSFDLDDAG